MKKYYLGVDLGGTNIAVGLVTAEGALLRKDSVPTASQRGYEPVIRDMAALCKKVAGDSGVELAEISHIGVGSPGLCDRENGVILLAKNLDFKAVPLRAVIQKDLDLPVYLENDANCAALGEHMVGAARGSESSVTVTLGTGIGGGIILGGKIINGAYGDAGEIGHMVISFNGEPCTCGTNGCWEAYASATALIRQAKIASIYAPESQIMKQVNNDLRLITGKTVFDAADLGDETAKEVIRQYLFYVSVGLANLVNTLQPDTIALGGGICAQGEKILAPMREMTENMVFGRNLKTKLVTAALGNDAGIIGAAMLTKYPPS